MQGLGLIGLLIVVAIAFYLMFGGPGGGSAGTAARVQKEVVPQVQQIGGRDADGKMAAESITFEAGPKGVTVNAVAPGGAFEQKFGLKAGDVIVQIGPLDAKTQAADDATAKGLLNDAYARGEPLIVQRGGERLTLPQAPAPSANNPPQRTTPRGQLDGILKGRPDGDAVPTH